MTNIHATKATDPKNGMTFNELYRWAFTLADSCTGTEIVKAEITMRGRIKKLTVETE